MGAKVLPEATSSKPNDGQSAAGLTATSAGPPSTTDDKLSFGASLRFALPAFATTSLSLLISVYAVDFYSSIGTKIAFLSFFTALARSFDVITDPLMGWLSDRTRGIGRIKGRRRPYLFIGPAFYALAFSLLFYPPPFWPNTPGDGKELDPKDASQGYFAYGSAYAGASDLLGEAAGSNQAAAYWFGALYVTFYLTDTFSNVPYEALGPEMSTSPEVRSNLFFSQKLVNMLGMLTAAAAPSGLAYLFRWADSSLLDVPCDYLYHPGAAADRSITHGTYTPEQLMYVDTYTGASGALVQVNRTAELCTASGGDFCFETLYQNGTHFWYEQSLMEVEQTCAGSPPETVLQLDRFSTSSLASYQKAFLATAVMFGMYYMTFMWTLAFTIREKPQPAKQTPIPLLSSIMRSLNNRAFRPLLIAWGMDGLGLAALVTMFPFYIRYIIQPDGAKAQAAGQYMDSQVCMAGCVFALLTMAIIGSLGWLWISRRYGKFVAWQAYNFVSAATNLLFFLPGQGSSWMVIFVSAANGIPVGGQFLTNAVTSDVIDYDNFLNGVRSEGAFSVFATLIPKFVAIPASALPLAAISMLGFIQPVNGVAQVQSVMVNNFISAVFVLLPFTCAAVSFFIKFMYPIKADATVTAIRDGIALHDAGLPALDPLTGLNVKVRRFEAADDEQALLMESFTSQQLTLYKLQTEDMLAQLSSHASVSHVVSTEPQEPATSSDTSSAGTAAHPVCTALSDKIRWMVGLFVTSAVASVALCGGTFYMLEDQAKAIVPILGCISSGFSCALLGVACIRYRTARQLESVWIQPAAALPDPGQGEGIAQAQARADSLHSQLVTRLRRHVGLLDRVIIMKERGAAGGWLNAELLKDSMNDMNCNCKGRAAVSSAAADAPVTITVVPSAIGRKASN